MKLINGIITPSILTFGETLQMKIFETVSETGKEIFSIDEAAIFLKVSSSTVKNYSKKKMISWRLVGKEKVFTKKDLLDFLERRKIMHRDF